MIVHFKPALAGGFEASFDERLICVTREGVGWSIYVDGRRCRGRYATANQAKRRFEAAAERVLKERLATVVARQRAPWARPASATGRLSSTNPKLQNIPIKTALGREIRAAFIAAPGRVLLSADYSAVELRLMTRSEEVEVA